MASITEYLIKLQKLTQVNLDILQAINDSFFTKKDHLSVTIGDNQYAIPSFISLENKLNSLTANFENLVNSPESGEAFFNFDGNSRAIQVRPYTSVPNSLTLKPIYEFGVDNNNIFKDFMTPNPYINIDLQTLPNDIVQVMVKKIVPIHADLLNIFTNTLTSDGQTIVPSVQYPYKDLYKILYNYKKDIDYIEYNSKIDLPVRKNIGSGVYVIKEIQEDIIDDNLDNFITIKFRDDMEDSVYMNSLKYRLFDETIERPLKVGDQLTTYDGKAKVEVTEIRTNTNTLVVKVLHGEYLNLMPTTSNNPEAISSLSKLKFYSPINFSEDKYIKIPLEEDRYVFVAVAALNGRMNVQSPWGSGLMLDTYKLSNSGKGFDKYYEENVKNVGDILFEIVSMMSNTLMKYNKDEFESFTNISPIIDPSDLLVTQINKHLNDSISVKNIRSLYSQKKDIQAQLNEVENEINTINTTLASVSFDDTTGVRAAYISQLSALSTKRNDFSTSITKIMNDIATTANNSEVPIENAKYRIRGFFNYVKYLNNPELDKHVKGIRVQYRYKNVNQEQGNALSINDTFIFSDWIDMKSFDRERIPQYENGYKFDIQPNNDKVNEPSFNQIDIPISQGETVDIRLKLVYDYGYPFTYTTSQWSPIINIAFPEEYLKDIQILDIISENNDEIESNRFNNIIKEEGILEHVGDKITDQDIIYFHKPENIASGFYTAERRIIPLKDKLTSMDSSLTELRDEVYGTHNDSIKVSIKHGSSSNTLLPYQIQNIAVESYSSLNTNNESEDNEKYEGLYDIKNNVVTTVFNISLYNDSNHTVKLYSMFPGNRDTQISLLKNHKYAKSHYTSGDGKGVWLSYVDKEYKEDSIIYTEASIIQGGNQFIYFRINDINDGSEYYKDGPVGGSNQLSLDRDYIRYTGAALSGKLAYMYPRLSDKYGLCLDSNAIGSYLVLGPHQEIVIPIIFEYYLSTDKEIYKEISKTMSFEILPSLYKDPIAYTFRVVAKYDATSQDKVVMANKKKYRMWWHDNDSKYNSTIK